MGKCTNNILNLEEDIVAAEKFVDAENIPAWSKGAIGAVVNAGIMGGYPDGTFRAGDLIKRAEAVVALDRAINGVESVDVIYDRAGNSSGSMYDKTYKKVVYTLDNGEND